jgi:hypothetical protein
MGTPLGDDMRVKLKRDVRLLEVRHEGSHPTPETVTSEAKPTSRACNGETLNC